MCVCVRAENNHSRHNFVLCEYFNFFITVDFILQIHFYFSKWYILNGVMISNY